MLTLGSLACSSSTTGRGGPPADCCSRSGRTGVQQHAWQRLAQRGSCSAGAALLGPGEASAGALLQPDEGPDLWQRSPQGPAGHRRGLHERPAPAACARGRPEQAFLAEHASGSVCTLASTVKVPKSDSPLPTWGAQAAACAPICGAVRPLSAYPSQLQWQLTSLTALIGLLKHGDRSPVNSCHR